MRTRPLRMVIVLACGVVALSSTGCLTGAFVWAYPAVSRTRAVPLERATGEVYAVRAGYRGATPLGFDKTPADVECVLTPLAVDESVPAQHQLSVNRGWWYGLVGWGEGRQFGRTVAVRLYRPGYRTVVIHPTGGSHSSPEGDTPLTSDAPPIRPSSPDGVMWVRATTIDEQHGAVLKLVDDRFARPASGSASPEHRKVLLFAVSELERLARECPETGDGVTLRKGLLDDAARYRELAEGHPKLPAALRSKATPDRIQSPQSP